jgi:hypothetical protein
LETIYRPVRRPVYVKDAIAAASAYERRLRTIRSVRVNAMDKKLSNVSEEYPGSPCANRDRKGLQIFKDI